MPKIGGERYPELSVEDAIEVAEVLVNDFGGEAKSQEAFAQSLGHSSSNSGTYYSKIADVRNYGLMPSRGIEATELAFEVANPRNERELAEVKFEMYENIEILSEIYDSLSGNDAPDDFWRVIAEVTETNPKEARDAEKTILELYRGMRKAKREMEASKETAVDSGETETTKQTEGQRSTPQEPSEPGIFVRVGEEELRLSETSNMYIDLARDFLESMKSHSGSGDEEEDDEHNEDDELKQSKLE